MNDDLNTSLHHAVDAAIDQALTPDALRKAVAERIRAKNRRRPALILGATLGSLALVGGTAFAAVQLLGDDDRPPVPDVIGSPRPGSSTTPADAATTGPSSPFPPAEPDAVFPACGAILEPPSMPRDLVLQAWPADGPLGTSLETRVLSIGGTLRAEVSSPVALVAVKDGVVVGSAAPTPPSTTTTHAFTDDESILLNGPAPLAHTLCTDGTTPLPPGRYSIWGSQTATITERTPFSGGSTETTPVATHEEETSMDEVATLWMGADGTSTVNPGIAAGWPQNLSENELTAARREGPVSVVWVAVSEDETLFGVDPLLVPARDKVADLGYVDIEMGFMCQPGAPVTLGISRGEQVPDDRYGITVTFSTPAEAEAFAALWEPLHGPVAGIVTDDVVCHLS